MITIDAPAFHGFEGLQRAVWSPVLFRPIMGSPEQFVIGIAVVGEDGVYLERANQLRRLECVFADSSQVAIAVAEAALNVIEADLLKRSDAALTDFRPAISGVVLGDIREAQGISLQQIAASWMAALSSLYVGVNNMQEEEEIAGDSEEESDFREGGDRLPTLILEYVIAKRPTIKRYFHNEIRNGRQRRRNAHGVIIDFAGSRLVANFGTLASNSFNTSVGRIKTRLWDLKVDRDSQTSALAVREHEMIVHHPPMNDPQMSKRQVGRLKDALHALEEQADQEEIRLRAMNSVEEIGDHILAKEAA